FSAFSTYSSSCATCTLSLHDALPISRVQREGLGQRLHASTRRLHIGTGAVDQQPGDDVGDLGELGRAEAAGGQRRGADPQPGGEDRKSTRLNSSHVSISYAVFCLKNK